MYRPDRLPHAGAAPAASMRGARRIVPIDRGPVYAGRMRIDRRAFMRTIAATAAWLTTGAARAEDTTWQSEIHQQTRNTRWGPAGRTWWPTRRRTERVKDYPGRPRVALPAPRAPETRSLASVVAGWDAAGRGLADDPLTLPELSRLLYFANGITRTPLLRAAPSAGALYAGEIYVITDRVSGLEPGLYYYRPPEQELVRLSAGRHVDAVRAALEQPAEIGNAPVVVLLTNVFARYGWRYANRGYRYALIDTGHIGENLRVASRSAGLAERSPLRFADDPLNDLLGVDGRQEAVCALHAAGRPGAVNTSDEKRSLHESRQAPAGWGTTERYHARTRLVAADGVPQPAPTQAGPPPGEPGPERPATSVEDCILNRRSASRFDDRPMDRATLDWMLDTAAGETALSRGGWLREAPVELLLAVHRVRGLAAGLYRYDPAAGMPVPLREGDLRKALVRTCLGQEKAGQCGVACFMVADLRRAQTLAGERSYRDLLVESGAIGQRIYLAAEAAGLCARNLAAFRDDELCELLGLDGRERVVLHLTLAGHGT